ncbi:MAG: hypothetical protein SFV54_08810 [Bryobacteraceae bacterium]|nr:hypothetical protein [Bryobacteraceae bacterium]
MKKSSKQPESKGLVASPPALVSTAAAQGADPSKAQIDLYSEAVRFFQEGKYQDALTAFGRVAAGPNREVSHSAQLHVRMCEQRLSKEKPELKSPDDHYHYAITLINRRQLDDAERHLQIALAHLRDAEHVHYALALAMALKGELQSSYEHLKKAIDLEPRNRSLARNDADFQDGLRHSPLRELVYPERG